MFPPETDWRAEASLLVGLPSLVAILAVFFLLYVASSIFRLATLMMSTSPWH